MPAYPLAVTKGLGTWNAQRNHVERIMDNSAYDAAHPDDTLLVSGPARKGVAVPGRNTPLTHMAVGQFQSFSMQSQVQIAPLMSVGSGRCFFLRGKSQSSWSIQRPMFNGRNLLRSLYHNAVEVAGLNPDQFDDPAAVDGAPQSQYFINLDSELYYIPFGLGLIMRTKSRTLVAGCYLELCMISSYGSQVQSGGNMIAEAVSGVCDRILPWQASDAMENVKVGRALMDAVLGLAPNVFPEPNYNRLGSFADTGLNDGTVQGLSS